MSDAQEYLSGLVKDSPGRMKVLEVIYSLGDSFTVKDIGKSLEEQGIKYAEGNISSMLRGLCVRGLLTQFDSRTSIRTGAFTIHYVKVNSNYKAKYYWDFVEADIKLLLNTELKEQIFDRVNMQQTTFSSREIVDQFHNSGISIDLKVVQNLLRTLRKRNYLVVSGFRGVGEKGGRTSIRYSLKSRI